MKNKVQVYRCAETVARMFELKIATWTEIKVEVRRVNSVLTIARRPARAQSCCCLKALLYLQSA